MVSVTSEVSANASFQSAAARSARPDSEPTAGNDSFAALVDSNTAASRNDRAQDSAPAPRRNDDTATDNRSRDNAAASDKAAADKAARNASNDRDDAAAKARRDDQADSKVDTDTKAATPRRAKSKSDAPKSDKSDETTQASSGDASPAPNQTETTPDGTADAVAVAIPAAAAPAATASATSATDKATAPLAIAAAAIAATASLAAETAPATSGAEGTEANTTATAGQADGAKTAAQTNAQAGVGQAVSAPATAVDSSIATGIAASVVAATPAATKPAVQLKNPDLARKSATTAVEPENTAGTAATGAPAADTIVPAVTPPTEAAGKTKSENGIADAVKADASGNSTAPSAAHANAHFAVPDVSQAPVNSSGNGLQAGAIQTQQAAAPTTTPAASQLTATAATGAAVPLSGLAMEIAASANSGKTRFEIRLDPAELGRIDVRIDIDRHGQVTSHLTVDRPETLSMLRQDANQLQRALDNAGLSTGNSGLQFSLRDQSSQGQNDGNQSNPNAHRLVVSEDDTVPAVVAGRSYGRMLGSSSGVDIRV